MDSDAETANEAISKVVGRLDEQRLGLQSGTPAPGAKSEAVVFDLASAEPQKETSRTLAERYEPLRQEADNRRKYKKRHERYGFGQVKRHG